MQIQHWQDVGMPSFRDESYLDRSCPLGARWVSYATGIKEFDPDGVMKLDKTYGDIQGAMFAKPAKRATGSWWHGCPVIKKGGSFKPIRDREFGADDNYEAIDAAVKDDETIDDEEIGIVFAASREDGAQELIFIPSAGKAKLIAPNQANSLFEKGTDVFDMDGEELDEERVAKLQTAWRVFNQTTPSAGTATPKGRLAWQLGKNGEGDNCMGLCVDDVDTSIGSETGGGPMWAYMGRREGGPLWVGEKKEERHKIGVSVDGEMLCSGHIDHLALFKMAIGRQTRFKRGDMFDGPLEFQEEIYDNPKPLPFHQKTHLWWDPEKKAKWRASEIAGMWRWLTEDAVGGSVPPVVPPTPPGPPTPPQPPPPTDPVPPGDPVKPKEGHRVAAWYSPDFTSAGRVETQVSGEYEDYRQSPLSHAFASELWKASWNTLESPDFRDYLKAPSENDLWSWVTTAPIVAREECYGAYPDNITNPTYTHAAFAPESPFLSGTGSGGKILFQPEIKIADFRNVMTSGNDPEAYSGTVSEVNRMVAPLVYLGWGYPDLDTGGIYKGYRSRVNLSMEWILSNVLDDGTETSVITAPGDATADPLHINIQTYFDESFGFYNGLSFRADFDHSNSAHRTYELQNKSGTLAHLDDIPDELLELDTATTPDRVRTIDDTLGIAVNTGDDDPTMLHRRENPSTGINFTADEYFQYWQDGSLAFGTDANADLNAFLGDMIASYYLALKGGTAFKTELQATPTTNRTITIPDETGQIKLKKNKVVNFWSGGQLNDTYSAYPIHQASTSSGRPAAVGGFCPDDFSSLVELVLVIIPQATDASVSVDRISEYGASGEDHAANTSSTTTTLNLTAGKLTEVSVSALFASLAAQDYMAVYVESNDAATAVNVFCMKMVYVSTD